MSAVSLTRAPRHEAPGPSAISSADCRGAMRPTIRALALAALPIAAAPARAADPLPSWADGPAKKAIVAFVTKVTKEGGPDFVPREERIAVFDNDGTLWSEKPLYFQLAFALDRVKALVEK